MVSHHKQEARGNLAISEPRARNVPRNPMLPVEINYRNN